MSVLEIILLILFGISAVGNVFQAFFGIKIEVNQSQVSQNYNLNQNINDNINLINDTIILTNAYIVTSVVSNATNFKMVFPVISTNIKTSEVKYWAITNQSNYINVGLNKRK